MLVTLARNNSPLCIFFTANDLFSTVTNLSVEKKM